ncbi:MAG: MATE family efflux transporter [Clostridia bacterium]|nr:MATE family efflux transporter [Clostridia bacterium]
MTKIKNVNMLEGPLLPAIIRYAIPILLMGLVQKLFGAVDIMVLGWVADTDAVASVGASNSIIHLLIDSFFGISVGTRVVLARLIGAGDQKRIKAACATSVYLSLLIGVLTGILGFIFAPAFLDITKCPTECYEGALIYMRVYLLASPVILLYNFGSAILAVAGDTQRPMYYMLVSGGLNFVLNLALCMVLEQKVAAVAIATAVSQLVGALLVTRQLFRMEGPCRLRFSEMRWSFSACRKILAQGAPVGLATALYPLSNLQIQTQINSFGAATIAGNTAMANIESIVATVVATPMANSITGFAGQNLGAGKHDRVKKSVAYCISISVALGVCFSVICTVLSRPLISLFVSEEAAIVAAKTRMRYVLQLYCISCANTCLSRLLQTFGYSLLSTVNSVFSVLCFRIFWTELVYPKCPTFEVLCQCFTVSWLLLLLLNVAFTFYIYHFKFKKGEMKKLK